MDREAVAYAQSLGLETHIQSWSPCPLRDETVDVVTFVNVLDHLRDPFGAMREAWRVLRPEGLLYIRVPNGPFHARLLPLLSAIRLSHFAVFHLFGFSRPVFLRHLPRLGCIVVAIRTTPQNFRDSYSRSNGWEGFLRIFLKVVDRGIYRLFRWCGLGQLAWGSSIEVMAYKASKIAADSSGCDETRVEMEGLYRAG